MSKVDEYEIPEGWGLSAQQELVVGSLIDERSKCIPPFELCNALYPDDKPYEPGTPAPAKLRVLVGRCRAIISKITEGRAKIELIRGKGWRITKKSRAILRTAVDD